MLNFTIFSSPQVVDMGCAECKLLKSLKFHRHIESLIGVDIDSSLLESHHHSLQPLVTDYLQRRPRPLKIQLLKGWALHCFELETRNCGML